MRSITAVAFAVILTGALIGCGGKGNPTPTSGAPESMPNDARPADTPPAGTAPTESPKHLKVEIAKAKVTVNGAAVAIPAELPALEKVFGKPSGAIDDPVSDSNKYVYWNGLGVRASQDKTGKQLVREIHFYFTPTYDLSAKAATKPFGGELLLEGQPVTKVTKAAELGQKIKILREVNPKWWSINYEEARLQVTVSPDDEGMSSIAVAQPLIDR